MTIRSRGLVAHVVLISFSASLAEGLWASSCAGAEPGDAMAGMEMSMPFGDHHPMDAPFEHEQRSDEGSCPLPALLGAGDRLEVTGLFRPPQQ